MTETKKQDAQEAVWARAREVLVAGVDSPVRAFRHIDGKPLMLARAEGAEVVDTAGRRYIDFVMGWGPLILGHNHPQVLEVVEAAVKRADLLGMTHVAEAALARRIVDAVGSVEQVRFTVSGTEADMTAVRLARAHTGRSKIVVFEGAYHGHSDSLLVGQTEGISEGTARETLRVPYNDIPAFEKLMAEHGKEVACVIVEPVAANMGVIPPVPGFLESLRIRTTESGSLLIFDEVVTAFRLGYGGAQDYFGIYPDLTTFGKIIGGGYPIGALGGKRGLMQLLAPEGKVYHGGTFAGHPLSMAAGLRTLEVLEAEQPYAILATHAQLIKAGIESQGESSGIPVRVNQIESMFTAFFSEEPVVALPQVVQSKRDRFARWMHALLDAGFLIAPSPFEGTFVSQPHTRSQIEGLIDASARAFKQL